MNVTKLCLLLSLAALTAVPDTTETATKAKEYKPVCAIRDLPQQVVLYTIYRGNIEDVGPVVADLFSVAGQNGIYPDGPLTFVYPNYFQHVSSEHWLTEIRMPVDKNALKVAGKLGKMTDVKTISPMKVAATTKPEGMANPEPIYRSLYTWMLKEDHMPIFGPQETFLTNVESADYAQMKTEIMAPIWDVSSE